MSRPLLTRTRRWDVRCSKLEQRFRVQFWRTSQTNNLGQRRMAFAVWWQNRSDFELLGKTTGFYSRTTISCDGPQAAVDAVRLVLDGMLSSDPSLESLKATTAAQ